MVLKSFVVFTFLLSYVNCVLHMEQSKKFSHHISLANGDIKLFWTTTDDDIIMELHGKTKGWVAVGFSTNGGMAGSDIILGWVANGTARITDRHGIANAFPPKDKLQNVELISGSECNGWTILKFRRQLGACDDFDRSITRDTQRVIWAYGNSDPFSEDIQPSDKHSYMSKGSISLVLLDDMPHYKANLENSESTDTITIKNDAFKVPAVETYYHCAIYKLPELTDKHHVIRARPVVTKGNEMITHHMLLYQCDDSEEDLELEGVQCFSPDMPAHYQKCNTLIAGFAIGGTDFYFPAEAGYPIGGKHGSRYVEIQIHYDNPMLRSDIIDSSGIELTYTSSLRKYDSGMVLVGNSVSGFEHFIPPNTRRYTTVGHCPSQCLSEAMDFSRTQSIKVFSTLLHTHVTGRSIQVRHIRNGTELPHIAGDSTYDFNYQEIRFNKEEPEVLPTDHISVKCTYDTTKNKEFILGGLGSRQEMCVAFLFYYPKIDLMQCSSNPIAAESYSLFNIANYSITGVNGLYDVHVTDPEEIAGMSAFDIMNKMEWNEENTKILSDKLDKMTQTQKCEGALFKPKSQIRFLAPEIQKDYEKPKRNCEESSSNKLIKIRKTECSSFFVTKVSYFVFALSLVLSKIFLR